MEGSWWPALFIVFGLALPGALAPVTFFVKHMSNDGSEEFPPPSPYSHHLDLKLKPPPKPVHYGAIRRPVIKTVPFQNALPTSNSKSNFQSRVYPGYSYNEDFGSFPSSGDSPLASDFPGELDFPGSQTFPTQSDEPSRPGKGSDEYAGPTAYAPNMESGEPPDYQTYYGSDEVEGEGEEEPSRPPDEAGEYSPDEEDEDDSGPINYEVEEKIPDDLKYKPPKVKVYPLPPPCLGATPPPYPTVPPPPKPTKRKPKPKPKPGGAGYYRYAGARRPVQRGAANQFRASTSRFSNQPRQRIKYSYSPYVVRQINLPSGPIIVRTRTIPSVKVSSRPATPYHSKKPIYQKQTTGGDKGNAKEVVKEVHIHHHHDPPLIHPATIPAIVPLYPLFDENGYPVHRADQYLQQQGRSLDKQNTGMTGSGSAHIADVVHIGRFAEPPPHTTSKYENAVTTYRPSPKPVNRTNTSSHLLSNETLRSD